MLYFRRTMVMSEEEKEEEPRRDAAISTNCDIHVPSPPLPSLFSSPTGLGAAHAVIGCENLDFTSDFKNKAEIILQNLHQIC